MGPLEGFTVIEIAGIGPGPFAAMMLADMGANVIRVDRMAPAGLGITRSSRQNVLNRGRRSIAVDLKAPEGVGTVLRLVEKADALVEGFRPGVADRLGIGPDACLARNPKLVYGRMTGWGQTGPLAKVAGHDINYVALSGALHAIGPTGGPPVPPLNLVGDFGGGGMLMATGMLAAMLCAQRTGKGQVVDTAMTEGAALLLASIYGLHGAGQWSDERGANFLDGGAHNYGVYETSDGKYVAIGSLEDKFHELLFELTGIDEKLPPQYAPEEWPRLKDKLAAVFKTRTRDEWCEIMEGTDVCFAPVLSMAEAPHHPHNKAREAFVEIAGITQPAPAPRFSITPGGVQRQPPSLGEHSREVLEQFGFASGEIDKLMAAGVVAQGRSES
jgi:alpha-methylacyl-CoA racemase